MKFLKIKLLIPVGAILAFVFIAIALFVNDEPRRSPESITFDEAQSILDNAYQATMQQNLVELCSLGGSKNSCQNEWRNHGEWVAVGDEAPSITGTRLLLDQKSDSGSTSLGGLVLIVEGTDGFGQSYATDFLIFDDGENGLVALNPVYWTGTGVGHANPEGGTTIAKPVSTPKDS